MSTDEFWSSSLKEIAIAIGSYYKRRRHEYEVAAFTAANIMNAWGAKIRHPNKLLRGEPSAISAEGFATAEAFHNAVAKQKAEDDG